MVWWGSAEDYIHVCQWQMQITFLSSAFFFCLVFILAPFLFAIFPLQLYLVVCVRVCGGWWHLLYELQNMPVEGFYHLWSCMCFGCFYYMKFELFWRIWTRETCNFSGFLFCVIWAHKPWGAQTPAQGPFAALRDPPLSSESLAHRRLAGPRAGSMWLHSPWGPTARRLLWAVGWGLSPLLAVSRLWSSSGSKERPALLCTRSFTGLELSWDLHSFV